MSSLRIIEEPEELSAKYRKMIQETGLPIDVIDEIDFRQDVLFGLEHVDIILCSIMVAEQVLQKIEKSSHHKRVKVIVISGDRSKNLAFLRRGADDCITWPSGQNRIQRVLKSFMD